MAMADVIKSCLDSIRNISDHIEDAIVYLDAGCTEAFQFVGAFPLILELGACTVCSLENNTALVTVADWKPNFNNVKKVVVITSRLLSDSHRYILRCLSTHQIVLSCAIFTSISEIAHSAYIDSPLGPDAFHEYESLLIQDYEEIIRKRNKKEHSSPQVSEFDQSRQINLIGRLVSEDEGWSQFTSSEEDIIHSEASPGGRDSEKANPLSWKQSDWQRLVASVHHFPMILCPLSPRVFVLPSEGAVAEACLSNKHEDSLSPGLPPISTGSPIDGEDIPPGATLTAHFIYHLAAKMDLKIEIYSLGDSSKTVGKILMDMSSLYDVGRRKRSAGLLLIDRTLDLITPCCHGDSLIDRMFSSLPRRERTLSPFHVTQIKNGPGSVQRSPLDFHIPLRQVLSKKDSVTDDIPLEKGFNAFMCGWNSSHSESLPVDLTNLSRLNNCQDSTESNLGMLNGSLVSTEHHMGVKYLEALLERRTKDGTLLIKKWLQETLRREKLSVNSRARSGFATTAELNSMVRELMKDQSSIVRNRGIIQVAAAALLALSEPHSSHWDAFVSAEKILRVSATSDTSQSLSAQIRDLVNKSVLRSHEQNNVKNDLSQGPLSFHGALLVAVIGYVLAGENFPTFGSGGPFSWEEEHFLKESIVDAILEDPSAAKLKFLNGIGKELEANLNKMKSDIPKEDFVNESTIDDFDDEQWENWGDEETNHTQNSEQVYDDMQLKLELRDRVDNLFKFLHKLASLKGKDIRSRGGLSTLDNDYIGDPYDSKGLLNKLLSRVLSNHEIPGLEYHSSTVGRLLKSGFGRFGLGQAKPSLGDQSIILVFVVGGITGQEVFEAMEALSQSGRADIELIIGGTTLLTPDSMLDLLLGSSSYF